MSRFYVGQRVRLVKPFNPDSYGLTGTIKFFRHTPKGTLCMNGVTPIDGDCVVLYDGKSRPSLEHTSRIEPITDSYDKVEWSECLWRPTQGDVTA